MYQLHLQQQTIQNLEQKETQLARITQLIQTMYDEFGDKSAQRNSQLPPLVLLDKLRAQLRILFDNKREFDQRVRLGAGVSSDEDALAKLEAKIAENRALLLEK